MSLEMYLAYFLACTLMVILPGPMVTLVIATSLTHGTRAGLLNVLGNQVGLAIIVGIVAAGLVSLVSAMGEWFELVRWAGAAYLAWLGWKLLRSQGDIGELARPPRGGFLLQGFLVSISNPKTLLFFGAFIPQFVDPARAYLPQMLAMGVTAMGIAAVSDGAYAVLSGKAGSWISQRRVRLLNRISGVFLIGGGAWLAFSRSRS